MADTLLPESVCALERLLARRRQLSSALLSMDGYDRWGYPDEAQRAQLEADQSAASAEHAKIEATLAAEVPALGATRAADVERWADAHVALLDQYVATLDETKRTEKMVAGTERAAWLEVRAGTRALVEENVHYVRHDPVLYRSLFGFDPT